MDNSRFSWTQEFRKSWETVAKTSAVVPNTQPRPVSHNKKNIIRHLLLCVDTSASVEKSHYVPTVRSILSDTIPAFVELFRRSNPLSMISFLTCRNTFEKYAKEFAPTNLLNTIGTGDFSLLNCLRVAIEMLKTSSYNRELLIITASIGTKDSGEYEQTLAEMKKHGIKVNMISICGEVTLFKRITELSGGTFAVPLDRFHFEILLDSFTQPLECLEPTSSLVKLAFPSLVSQPALCLCHLKLQTALYECPVCKAFVCSLPHACPVCLTQLASPLDISRSLYFMYPLSPFPRAEGVCKKCGEYGEFACEKCRSVLCETCEKFVREELGFCIFC